MGNTGISRGTGNKGKSPSHLQISFPTKKPTRTGKRHSDSNDHSMKNLRQSLSYQHAGHSWGTIDDKGG